MFFLSCDIQTGEVLAELPLSIDGNLTNALSTTTEATFSLPVRDPRCPKDWEGLTSPWRVWLVVVNDDGTIIWGGIPQNITMKATSPIIKITAVSPEDYLSRRFVPSKRFDQKDQTSVIAKWLVERATIDGIHFAFDCKPSGVLRDREYYFDDSATVLKRLQELSAVQNGFEWRIDLKFVDNNRYISPVFRTGYPRIGIKSDTPQAVFELPGGLLDVSIENRWDETDAATHFLAKGSGEGEDTPFSSPHVAYDVEDSGIPRLEMVQTFDSVKEQATLDAHAQTLVKRFKGGTQVLSLTQRIGAYPRAGIDFNIGDDVRVEVSTDTVRINRKFRCVGWSVDGAMETLKPIVADFD